MRFVGFVVGLVMVLGGVGNLDTGADVNLMVTIGLIVGGLLVMLMSVPGGVCGALNCVGEAIS